MTLPALRPTATTGRWWTTFAALLPFCFALAQVPANNDPCGAVALTVNATCTNLSGTPTTVNATATAGIPAPGCAGTTYLDVWYRVTVPANGSVSVQTTAGTITDSGIAAYTATSCSGTFTLVACNDDFAPGTMSRLDLSCRTPGSVLYIRLWRKGGGTGTFNICAVALPNTPSNDDPCGAIALPPNTSCVNTAATTVSACNTTSVAAPACATYSGSDVWFSITLTSPGGLTVTTAAGTMTDSGLELYSATSCSGTFTSLGCNDNISAGNTMSSVSVTYLAAGTYYARVWRKAGGSGTFSICAVFAAAPSNDNPCSATVLNPGASCVLTAGSNTNASGSVGPPAPGCAAYTTEDVWYSLNLPTSGVLSLQTTAGTLLDAGMALYSATACNGTFTLIQCDDNNGPGNMPQIDRPCQAAGLYYVRLWGNGGLDGTFNICAVFTASPTNDNPCTAIALPVGASCVLTAASNVCTTASPGIPDPGCATYTTEDVWFTVNLTTTGNLSLQTTAGTLTDGGMALYSATACNGTFTLIECDDDDGPGSMPQIDRTCQAAGIYYVRVWGFNGAEGTFNICAVQSPIALPPANDEPCSATTLTPGPTCSPTSGTNVNACQSISVANPPCGNYTAASADVWYSFTVPSSGIATIQTTAGTLTDASMALYSGSCGSLTLVECDADDGPGTMPVISRADLSAGATYHIRIWGSGGATGTFQICIVSPTTPEGTSCVWLLQLYDTGGDGWGTSQVGVSINGGPATPYTITAAMGVFLFGVNIGQNVSISYTNSGPNQTQNSFVVTLLGSSYPYFNSGSPPGNGVVFTQVVNCLIPSQSPEDCLGGKTLCGDTDSNENPQNTGNVSDLFPSNYGCLSSAERQGQWYIFRMASGGNTGFTVDPSGNDDYDWAIWGPYGSSSTTGTVCAPAGPPIRCSYASGPATFTATGSYNTGMGHPTYSGSPVFAPPSPPDTEGSGGNGWVKGITSTTGDVYLLYVSNYSQSGLAFQLTFQLSGGAALDCSVSLPVEFGALEAVEQDGSVLLEWSTLTEHHSDYFVVERSADGAAFQHIGTVEAAGESQHRIDYALVDRNPLIGANYYRLKQVDLDGAYEHSPTVVVLFGKEIPEPTVFPNPVSSSLNVAFDMPDQGTAYLQIVDVHGRVIKDRDLDVDAGPRTFNLPVDDLPPGTYSLVLRTTANGGSQNVLFIKE